MRKINHFSDKNQIKNTYTSEKPLKSKVNKRSSGMNIYEKSSQKGSSLYHREAEIRQLEQIKRHGSKLLKDNDFIEIVN